MRSIFRLSPPFAIYITAFFALYSALYSALSLADVGASSSYKDPTRPLQYSSNTQQSTAEQKLVLQAVFLGAGRRFAIINGEQLNIGQEVNGWRVHKIQTNQVQLNAGERWKTLRLLESIRK